MSVVLTQSPTNSAWQNLDTVSTPRKSPRSPGSAYDPSSSTPSPKSLLKPSKLFVDEATPPRTSTLLSSPDDISTPSPKIVATLKKTQRAVSKRKLQLADITEQTQTPPRPATTLSPSISPLKTPEHLTTKQFSFLRPNPDTDTPLTSKAKAYLAEQRFKITPQKDHSGSIVTVDKTRSKETYKNLSFLTPTKQRNGIYRGKTQEKTKEKGYEIKRLIGKAVNVRKRLSGYLSTIRHPEVDGGDAPFPRNVRRILATQELPDADASVEFGVIYSNVPAEILGKVEDLLINVQDTKNPANGYNRRSGGGGSKERKPLLMSDLLEIKRMARDILLREHPLAAELPPPISFTRTKQGVVKPKYTAAYRLARRAVYLIEDTKTGKYYVGKTAKKLPQRMSEHMTAVNTGKRAKEWHKELKTRPEDFKLRVLYKAPSKQKHILEEIERAYILALGSHIKDKGYNKNQGSTLLNKKNFILPKKNKGILKEIEKVNKVFYDIANKSK